MKIMRYKLKNYRVILNWKCFIQKIPCRYHTNFKGFTFVLALARRKEKSKRILRFNIFECGEQHEVAINGMFIELGNFKQKGIWNGLLAEIVIENYYPSF